MSAPVPLLALLALVAVALAALLSAGEAAVLRATRASLADALAEAGAGDDLAARHRAERLRRAQALVADAPATATALSFVRVVAEMLAITSITLVVAVWFDGWWEILVVALVASVVVGLVFVRLSPRAVGRRRPLPVLLSLSRPLTVVARGAGWVTRLTASREPPAPPTEDELRDMIDRVDESAVIEEEERELIRSVFELGATLAREVMVPRPDMVTVHRDTPLSKALRLFLRSGFSRVPVVGESVDDVVGVAYFKDVVRVVDASPDAASRPVGEVARRAVFVPESKPADDLLREMQASASHVAVVVDEYGGIAGLVTIEDVLEELVGELTDEHDRTPPPEVEDLGDGGFRVPARTPVDELGELFDLRLDDDDVDTAGGLLAKALGKVPLPGSTAEVDGLHLVAERVEGRRKQLATLLVHRAQPDPDPDDEPQADPTGRRADLATTPDDKDHRS